MKCKYSGTNSVYYQHNIEPKPLWIVEVNTLEKYRYSNPEIYDYKLTTYFHPTISSVNINIIVCYNDENDQCITITQSSI